MKKEFMDEFTALCQKYRVIPIRVEVIAMPALFGSVDLPKPATKQQKITDVELMPIPQGCDAIFLLESQDPPNVSIDGNGAWIQTGTNKQYLDLHFHPTQVADVSLRNHVCSIRFIK